MVMMTEHSDDRKPTWQGNRRRCRTNNRPDGTNKTGEKRSNATATTPLIKKETILVLHGNRQTGQLFLGRLDRLRKRLQKELPDVELLAVDAPHVFTDDDQEGDVSDGKTQQDDRLLLTWWHRQGNQYIGLKESLEKIQKETAHRNVVGLLGFSQGARLAHLLVMLHVSKPETWFPQLQFVILAAGYDAPLPPLLHGDGVCDQVSISLQSLHIWGSSDPLIYPEQSRSVSEYYTNPRIMVHPGKHFVPSKLADVDQYVEFIELALKQKDSDQSTAAVAPDIQKTSPQPELRPVSATNGKIDNKKVVVEPEFPDEETQVLQQEEMQALEAIFPEEIELQSPKRIDLDTAEEVFRFPIIYLFRLLPSEEVDSSADDNSWPPQPLTLRVQYPRNYPSEAIPIFTLVHENTVFQFPSRQVESLMNVMRETATSELGMSSVLSVIYAAKDFLDAPPSEDFGVALYDQTSKLKKEISTDIDEVLNESKTTPSTGHPLVQPSTADEIVLGNLEGLEIAESLLRRNGDGKDGLTSNHSKGGGSFGTYTIGLVGKPSAGKSTFFNAATAFSRQRGQQEGDGNASEWGGASMAAHPFTTIDPNIGYCYVPAPQGSCPEDDLSPEEARQYGSTHGRDPSGRRYLPVLLKDVAGLVPG
jgi:ribosome-binding ATPase